MHDQQHGTEPASTVATQGARLHCGKQPGAASAAVVSGLYPQRHTHCKANRWHSCASSVSRLVGVWYRRVFGMRGPNAPRDHLIWWVEYRTGSRPGKGTCHHVDSSTCTSVVWVDVEGPAQSACRTLSNPAHSPGPGYIPLRILPEGDFASELYESYKSKTSAHGVPRTGRKPGGGRCRQGVLRVVVANSTRTTVPKNARTRPYYAEYVNRCYFVAIRTGIPFAVTRRRGRCARTQRCRSGMPTCASSADHNPGIPFYGKPASPEHTNPDI